MIELAARIGRDWLHTCDPETAHALSINALQLGFGLLVGRHSDPRLKKRILDLDFPNPLGIAAGYDKNAEVPDALLGLGFGFAEVGTVTPQPQEGNPRPRVIRLTGDRAVINRLGFNNEGHARVLRRLRSRGNRPGIVGINIGANKDSEDRIADYEQGIHLFTELASYFTVNISSPNTPNLRDLQNRENLAELLTRVTATRDSAATEHGRRVPILLKIAPDLDERQLDDIAQGLKRHALDGLIVSNTTLSRRGIADTANAMQAGGLSGRPLFERSTTTLAKMRRRLGPDFPIVGVGGVDSTDHVLQKTRAGADLVQLYTGLVFEGPFLPQKILRGLSAFLDREGLSGLDEIRDATTEEWAARTLD